MGGAMSHSPAGTRLFLQLCQGASLTAACLTFPATALGDIQDIAAANNQLSAQVRSANVNYAETVNDGDTGNTRTLDSEGGRIIGYGLSASVMTDLLFTRDYFHLQYSTFSGTTDYVGSTQAKPAYGSVTGQSGAKVTDGSIRYGHGLMVDEQTLATLYGEVGRHRYQRTLGLGTPSGYQETYTHGYYGIGALLQYSPSHSFVYGLDLLIGRTYGASIAAALPAPYNTYSARLGNSTLRRAGVSVDYALTKSLHLSAGIDFVGWSYGASASQPVGNGIYAYEPNSTTAITTAHIGAGLAF